MSQDVLDWFAAESWPGNVRELRNQVERAVIMASEGEIQMRHLPGVAGAQKTVTPQVAPPRETAAPAPALPDNTLQVPVGVRMSEVEENYIRLTLKHTKNNKKRAAELLGLCLRTLHNKLRRMRTPTRCARLPRARAASKGNYSPGRVKRNVVPAPGADSAHIRPPCRSTITREIASPSPAPGRRGSPPGKRSNGMKIFSR